MIMHLSSLWLPHVRNSPSDAWLRRCPKRCARAWATSPCWTPGFPICFCGKKIWRHSPSSQNETDVWPIKYGGLSSIIDWDYIDLSSVKMRTYLVFIWRFPDMGGTPSHHPFLFGIFHEINQAFWWSPMTMETSICVGLPSIIYGSP